MMAETSSFADVLAALDENPACQWCAAEAVWGLRAVCDHCTRGLVGGQPTAFACAGHEAQVRAELEWKFSEGRDCCQYCFRPLTWTSFVWWRL